MALKRSEEKFARLQMKESTLSCVRGTALVTFGSYR